MSELARCPKKRCRHPLVLDVDWRGREVGRCEPCERNAAGLCRRCPRSLRSNQKCFAKYCPDCRIIVHRDRNAARDRSAYRETLNARPGYKEARATAAREWRKLHPFDAFDRAYERAKYAKRQRDPVKVAHDRGVARRAYHRRQALVAA